MEHTEDARAAVASQSFWYHTIEVRPGVETPGWFDLRPIVDRLPWPDVRGKRCLDVGTFDGFLAFELERRGVAEVVATDVPRPEDWDWPPHARAGGIRYQRENYGERTGRGFGIARELLGSSVRRETVGIYDLSPETVGTFDGFLAFELERRGAAEVVATDVPRPEDWDWPPHARAGGIRYQRENYGERTGRGFGIARELLGSSVRRETVGIYDLSPETVGTFDVVVCGSLLLHLRDPVRALEAVRSVCTGSFMSCEQVRLAACIVLPRKPVLVFEGAGDLAQWFVPNAAAHRDMLCAAGFRIERESRLYSVPYGVSHPPTPLRSKVIRRAFTGVNGVPHHAVLAAPATYNSGER